MKRSNIITFLSFIFLIFFLLLFMAFRKASTEEETAVTLPASRPEAAETAPIQKEAPETKGIETLLADTVSTETDASRSEESSIEESTAAETTFTVEETTEAETALMTEEAAETEAFLPPEETPLAAPLPESSLFIGDSRTVGLFEYAGLDQADFFCDTGMSVYNLYEKRVSIPGTGKVTLEELLLNKNYGKIYLMLGINELGYSFDRTISEYQKLVSDIRERQPDATLFLQANLHVTKSRSDQDRVINNPAIDRLNGAISELADGQKIYYLDANPLFDDAGGNLSSDKSEDNAHLYARYYLTWGAWITEQTSLYTGGDRCE